MLLKKKKLLIKSLIIIGISLYAYLINWNTGNIGVLPIDTFGFLESGNSILKGSIPIRDFWIFTGIVLDYIQALFILMFGNNWNSYVAHASFINILATLCVFFFLEEIGLDRKYTVLYCLSFATLCYPVIGTPFAYIHSYIFSLLSVLNFILAIKKRSNLLWFIFPFVCLLSFFSMQTPSAYILSVLFCFLIYYFWKHKNYKNFNYFLSGCISSTLLLLIFFYYNKISFNNFIYQYILFPLTIGEGRLSSNELAYVSLLDQLNFKRIFGDFKFIHFFLFPLTYLTFKNFFKKKEENNNLLNLLIIFCVILFIFNQLLTANQIYIFSLIPITASILHFNLTEYNINKKFFYLIILIVIISTIKFHHRFNIERKFLDLENVNKNSAIKAELYNKNFNKLKWISRNEDPKKELDTIKFAIRTIDKEKEQLMLLTHYQFVGTFLEKDVNIMNRWYLWDNNTHPTEKHKYFNQYKNFINKNLEKKNIKIIYLLGQENEILFENINNYFPSLCFESKNLIDKRFSSHRIISCNN